MILIRGESLWFSVPESLLGKPGGPEASQFPLRALCLNPEAVHPEAHSTNSAWMCFGGSDSWVGVLHPRALSPQGAYKEADRLLGRLCPSVQDFGVRFYRVQGLGVYLGPPTILYYTPNTLY